MAGILFTNFARSQLAAPLLAGDLSLTVETGHGARFPSPGAGEYFYLVLDNASLAREIVKCTSRAVDTLTIVRAQDNTTALGWNAGDVVALRMVAAALNDAMDAAAGADFALLAGAAFTGPLSTTGTLDVTGLLSADGGVAVPAGESGENAPQAQEVALLATTQLAGHRNKIINGNFSINQEAVSGSVVLAAGVYGHDMWKAGASGCSYTFASSEGITTLTISAGSLVQVIEGKNLVTGTYVLSHTGTAQGKIGAGSYAASGQTAAITGGANLNIEFGTGTVALVQFEPGTKPTPFEHRLNEFSLCLEYFWRVPTTIGIEGVAVPGQLIQYSHYIAFPTPMRATPTWTSAGFADTTNFPTTLSADNSRVGISLRAQTFSGVGSPSRAAGVWAAGMTFNARL